MRTSLVVLVCLLVSNLFGQTTPGIETSKFYDALNKGDSLLMSRFLSPDLRVTHYENDTSFSFDYTGFMTICPKFAAGRFHENYEIRQEIYRPGEDVVEVYFEFYLDGKKDHCGKDVVYWSREGITAIHSYETACSVQPSEDDQARWLITHLSSLLDNWHNAAAKANLKDYFSFMADDFYYLGTDPAERWTKEQFKNFCKPYFDKGEAWTFVAIERNFYFSADKKVIWFDEKLDTWMEECRASGVIELEPWTNNSAGGDYKLKHYNLTVTIENDKIRDFIKLRQE